MKLLWLIGASSAQLLSEHNVNTTTTVQSEDSEHNNSPQSKKKKVFDYGRRVQWYKNHCIGSPSHRIDCGYPGIDADQCAARKCCYDDTTQNVPFCYQSFLMSDRMIKTGQRVALLPKECPAKPSDRENCGYNRIKPDQCRSLGCCFDDEVKGVPWCFHKKEIEVEQPLSRLVKFTITQNQFCPRLEGINEHGIMSECTDGFRVGSICSLKCSNQISEMGDTFKFHCKNIDDKMMWLEEKDRNRKPECDVIMPVTPKTSRAYNYISSRLQLFGMQKLKKAGWCNAPPAPQYGKRVKCFINRQPGFTHQYFCDFKCDEGFQLVGQSGDVQRRSCPSAYGNSDKWSGDPVKCIPMAAPGRLTGITTRPEYCPGMYKSDKNIHVNCEKGAMENSLKCTYSCQNSDDRMMRGPAQVTCNKDQSPAQLPARPICLGGICNALNTFNGNADCTNEELEGSVCQMSCLPGYKLLGAAEISCYKSSWSAPIPKCVPLSLYSEGTCKINQIGASTFGAPQSSSRTRRVAGEGTPVKGDVSAFQVAIYNGAQFKCGGTLISQYWVMTAAHCLKNAKDLKVYGNVKFNAGLKRDLGVKQAIMHESYTWKSQFDIGLIELSNSIDNFNVDDLACLPPAEYQPDEQDLSIYGFGSMNTEKNIFPKNLLKGSLLYYPHNLCGYVKKRNNAENLFCAKGPSRACEGDSGGPVTFDDRQTQQTFVVGITSSGRCGNPSRPGLYVRVSMFIDWIHQHVIGE